MSRTVATPLGCGGFTAGSIEANGIEFRFIESGEGPLVLALHGFPDLPRTFRYQISDLAAAGYRVVAPYMRGYHPTLAPPDARYEQAVLVQDVLALIEALSPDRPVVLLGHDWGAQAAYGAAIIAPERVAGLVAMAVPRGLGSLFVTSTQQQRRSWYLFMFQMPFAEAAVAHDDFALLERLWQEWSPSWRYQKEEMALVKEAFRGPGVLPAALNYYRHTLNPVHHAPELESMRKRMGEPVRVPTLYLHGADDGCIGSETLEGMHRLFSGPLRKQIIPGAGHFLHQERPDVVNRLVREFLDGVNSAGGAAGKQQ